MDDLRGLKENIIIGHLVPAGTGIHRYQNVEFLVGEPLQEELDAIIDELRKRNLIIVKQNNVSYRLKR